MKTFIVDAFTDQPFRGNPAGVCLIDARVPSDKEMQSIAKELNLSETAFIFLKKDESTFPIRYYSPKMEIPLCGHATIASTKIMNTVFQFDRLDFVTIEGKILRVVIAEENISMHFPVFETHAAQVPAATLSALGLAGAKNTRINQETKILLLEIDDPHTLANLRPDFQALYLSHSSIHGVLVTASSGNDGYDYHSRYFWPWSGSNEDPVTGGTHTFLAKYWSQRLGKTRMRAFQSSERTGILDVELLGDEVRISGQAVVVFEGELKY